MLNKTIFRNLIIDTLQLADSMLKEWKFDIKLYSPEVVELLMGTCAVESEMGLWKRQIGGGPARGVFQIEPKTELSLWNDMLAYRLELKMVIHDICGIIAPNLYALENNLTYQILMARFRYLWVKGAIPRDLDKMAEYWLKGYNAGGKGTVEKFLKKYQQYC